jgi:hypothetical protein
MFSTWWRVRMGAGARVATSVAIVGVGLALLGGTASATSSVTAPTSGQAGKSILISGSGWTSSENAFVYLVQGTTQTYFCSVSTDTGGNLGPQTCTLPTSLPGGAYTLSVTDNVVTVNHAFTLDAEANVAQTSSGSPIGSVAAGQQVYLSGYGFTAGSTIKTVKVGSTGVTLNPPAPAVSSAGNFSGASFTFPSSLAAGVITVTVTDAAGHAATFQLDAYAATDTAVSAAVSGRNLSFSGAGWPDNETVYAYLDLGSAQTYMCSLGTDGSGDLGPQSCVVPTSLPQGSYVLSLTDGRVEVNKPFTLDPGAYVGTTPNGGAIGAVARGQTLYLSGTGFSANATITTVKVGNTTAKTSPAAPAVSSSGGVSGATFVVPNGASLGEQTVTVTDSAAQAATFKLAVYAATDTTASTGISGRRIDVTGAGWPDDHTTYVYLNQGSSSSYVCSVDSDGAGTLGPQSCGVPTGLAQGSYMLEVTDGSVTVTKAFTLQPGAAVGTTISGGALGRAAAGQTVYLSGTGFTGGTTIKKTEIGTTTLTMDPSAPAASSVGSFSGATVTVPTSQPVGPATFTVTDASKKVATFSVHVYDATVSAASSGVAGRNLTISGGGWPVYENVYAYLDQGTSTNYLCSVDTDDSGNLGPQTCTVPNSLPAGTYSLVLSDGQVMVGTPFTITPAITLDNTSGQQISSAAPGATIDLSGAGFTASTTISSVKVGTHSVTTTPSPILASSSGSFSGASFVLPASLAAGTYTVTATDASGKVGTTTLTVT